MNKSKWDTSDWWDWLFSHSDDAVVAELKSQADLLREALEVVEKLLTDKELEIISLMSPNCGRDYYFCCLCGTEAETEDLIEHQNDCLYLEITALIPKIKAALEAK